MAPMIGRNRAPPSGVAAPCRRCAACSRSPSSAMSIVVMRRPAAGSPRRPRRPSTPSSDVLASVRPRRAEPVRSLTIETRGGECPDGACGSAITIEADGRVQRGSGPDGARRRDQAVDLEALRIEIDQANFARSRAGRSPATCPTAFDGQETIYTFHVATGDEQIASCEVAIDPAHPLFVAVAAALQVSSRPDPRSVDARRPDQWLEPASIHHDEPMTA